MIEKCPVCNVRLKTINENSKCLRCDSDLTVFIKIVQESEKFFELAKTQFNKNQFNESLKNLILSIKLKKDKKKIEFFTKLSSKI